tara:strand:+ start:638 stop:1087 length:450 start_codon:yes stop_codon:yes gene_type:complete
MVEVVNSIVDTYKSKYTDRFIFYMTGSYARNETDFKDYDISIYDNQNECRDWEDVLYLFYNQFEDDGKPIDAQVDQMTRVINRMSGDTLHNYKDELVKRYVYSSKKLKDYGYIKYENIYGNLWQKEVLLVNPKHRDMGLDKIKRIYKEI